MNLNEALRTLGIPEVEEEYAADWGRIASQRPSPVPFLLPDYVSWACGLAHLPGAITRAAQATAARAVADPALRALAWYWHFRLFVDKPGAEPRDWPLLTEYLGPADAGMLYVLVLLSGTPGMLAQHKERGIPADVTDATMRDLLVQLETQDYSLRYREWGISPWICGWLLLHWRGELVRLGRLQFATSTFHGKLRAYRERDGGAVVALSEAGVRYRADGQVDGAGGVSDAEGGWTANLIVGEASVTGHVITPWGNAIAEPVTLPFDRWRPVLAPGDPVLDIHIPAGAPMGYDECGESIRWALEFFPRHFPDRPFVGFACGSWILDNQFEALLPASSNLVRFQKEVYLYPLADDGHSLVRTVFGYGSTPADLPRFARRTGMQRAFAAHLEAGGHFHAGGCFLLSEDFDWGSVYYRSRWPGAEF